VWGVKEVIKNGDKTSILAMLLYALMGGMASGLKSAYYVIIKVHFIGFRNFLLIQGIIAVLILIIMETVVRYEDGRKLKNMMLIYESMIFLSDLFMLITFFFPKHALLLIFVATLLDNFRLKSSSYSEAILFSASGNQNRSKLTSTKTSIFMLGKMFGVGLAFLLRVNYMYIVITALIMRPIMIYIISRATNGEIVKAKHYSISMIKKLPLEYTAVFFLYTALIMLTTGVSVYIKEYLGNDYVAPIMFIMYIMFITLLPRGMKITTSGNIVERTTTLSVIIAAAISVGLRNPIIGAAVIITSVVGMNVVIYSTRHYLFKVSHASETGGIVFIVYFIGFMSKIPFTFMAIAGVKDVWQFLQLQPAVLATGAILLCISYAIRNRKNQKSSEARAA
jgi:hypothetical protein